MAFDHDKRNIKEELEKMGSEVVVNELNHNLTVNGKYVFCYTNSYFHTIDGERLGRGVQDFLYLVKNDVRA